jgi:predicted DNA binding CopG/RHH family protein
MTDSDQLKDKLQGSLPEALKDHLAGKPLQLTPRALLPGIATGQYEQQPVYDKAELRAHIVDELARRDNRISIRVSGRDLNELQKLALAEGIPTQSLIANVVHQYVRTELAKAALSRSDNKVASKPQADLKDDTGTNLT